MNLTPEQQDYLYRYVRRKDIAEKLDTCDQLLGVDVFSLSPAEAISLLFNYLTLYSSEYAVAHLILGDIMSHGVVDRVAVPNYDNELYVMKNLTFIPIPVETAWIGVNGYTICRDLDTLSQYSSIPKQLLAERIVEVET